MKLIFALLLLTGCGWLERLTTHYTGSLTYKCSKHGIEYVQSDSGLAVSYERVIGDGCAVGATCVQPVRCN